MKETDILIIGAGLTGLTCAHYVSGKHRDFLVVDKQSRTGGVIKTESENGFVYETGPNTGVISHPEVVELFEELGAFMTPEIANSKADKRYVLKNGKWCALPSGLIGGIATPLFRWKDKFFLLGEPFRAPGTNPHETLADMVRRRMGQSFLDYAVDPFILGVYAGDPAQLVPKYALPKLYNLEQKYGSFIGGSVKKMREPVDPEAKKATRKIFSVKGGLSRLTDALQQSAGSDRFLLGIRQIRITKTEGGYLLTGADQGGGLVEIRAKRLVSTAGAYTLRDIFPMFPEERLAPVEKLQYTRVIGVALGFNQWKGMPLDGFGALIPYCEKRDILGIMFMSGLFENRAPEGGAMITVFIGGVRRQDLCELNDEGLESLLERELTDLLGMNYFKPDLIRIMRHANAIPQYRADSGERFRAIEALQNEYPGLILAGNIRDGIGMADRIKQGKTLAAGL